MTAPVRKRQEGLALLTVSLVLVLLALLSFAALNDSKRESTSGARSRATTRIVHSADAGIQLARTHLTRSPPDLTAIDLTFGSATIQSRSRSQSTPQTLAQVGLGAAPKGFSVNVGTGASFFNRIYEVNVTATSGSSTAEVEAKLSRVEAEGQGY